MACNVELKARLTSFAAAQAVAERVADRSGGVWRQRDTYFPCASGRLKLREIEGQPAELIWYQRENLWETRPSFYIRTPVVEPDALAETLRQAYGVRGVVNKTRHLYFWRNVRIHLDQVECLGSCLEFEAVLDDAPDAEEQGHAALALLVELFEIPPDARLRESYIDLLETLPS